MRKLETQREEREDRRENARSQRQEKRRAEERAERQDAEKRRKLEKVEEKAQEERERIIRERDNLKQQVVELNTALTVMRGVTMGPGAVHHGLLGSAQQWPRWL